MANKVKIKTNNTHIKKENLQEFLEVIDSLCFNINAQLTDINNIIEQNTNKLNEVTANINNILPEITNLNNNIKVLQDSIKEIKDTMGYGNNSNNNDTMYGVINCPKRYNKQGNYLVPTKEFPYRLNLVNINADNTLVLSFGYKGKNVLFKSDSLDKFEKPFCNFFPEKAGRYYIRGEYKERTGKLNLIAHKSKPFFGYEWPTHDILINHGCVPEDSDYFIIKDLSFYGGRGQFKDKPALYIYLGHVNLNDNGEVVSDVVLYSEQKYFESYIDVHPKGSYCIPILIGSNAIDIKIFGLYEKQVLMNVCNQGKLNKDVPHVLEMGTNFHYNLEEIFIHTWFFRCTRVL